MERGEAWTSGDSGIVSWRIWDFFLCRICWVYDGDLRFRINNKLWTLSTCTGPTFKPLPSALCCRRQTPQIPSCNGGDPPLLPTGQVRGSARQTPPCCFWPECCAAEKRAERAATVYSCRSCRRFYLRPRGARGFRMYYISRHSYFWNLETRFNASHKGSVLRLLSCAVNKAVVSAVSGTVPVCTNTRVNTTVGCPTDIQ